MAVDAPPNGDGCRAFLLHRGHDGAAARLL